MKRQMTREVILEELFDDLETYIQWIKDIAKDMTEMAEEEGLITREPLWHIIQDLEYVAGEMTDRLTKLKSIIKGGVNA